MNDLQSAKKPILLDLGAGALSLLLTTWICPSDWQIAGVEVGKIARLIGYSMAATVSLRAWHRAEEFQIKAPMLVDMERVNQNVALELYKTEKAAVLQAATTQTEAELLQVALPYQQQIHDFQQATLILSPQIEPAPQATTTIEAEAVEEEEEQELEPDPDTLRVMIGKVREVKQESVWVPQEQVNGFMMILGASGSGKTEALKAIATEVNRFQIPILVFDFHGDIAVEDVQNYQLSFAPGSKHGINPMELDSTDEADGGVYAQVNILLSLMKECVPAMGHRQRQVLKVALFTAYRIAEITDEDTSTWTKKPPTFRDVLGILHAWATDADRSPEDRSHASSVMDAVSVVFEHPVFSKPETISISEFLKHSHRLDLSKLEQDSVRFAVTDTLLRKIARALRSQGPIPVSPSNDRYRYRLFIFIDECKVISMHRQDDPNAILNLMATEYRKFGMAFVAASQRADHFSDEFRSQIAVRLVLKPLDADQAIKNGPDIGLPVEYLMELEGKGDGWLKMGSNAQPVRVKVTALKDRPKPKQPELPPAPEQPQLAPAATPQPSEEAADLWEQAKLRLQQSWELPPSAGNHPELPPASDTSESASETDDLASDPWEQPGSASGSTEAPANPEKPLKKRPGSSGSASKSTSEAIPENEVKDALKRLCTLLQEAKSTEADKFTELAIDDPLKALWFGISTLGLSQRRAIIEVFNRSNSGKEGFHVPSAWFKFLKAQYGKDSNG